VTESGKWRRDRAATWGEVFVPKTNSVKWTLGRWLLLAFAIAMLADSFLVPFYGPVDPGGSGAGILFLILGFRASSRRSLPASVVVAGGCAAALTLALNHRLLKSPSVVWTPLDFLLVLFVVFWGWGRAGNRDEQSQQEQARPDAQSILDATGKHGRT
jgi:hypothetical protein